MTAARTDVYSSSRAWKRRCRRTDADECAHTLALLPTPHDLRHTYASDVLRVGRTPRAVADLLGHSDASLEL
jgi:integrase